MGKVLVLYYSQTGNTKKIAELVVEGVAQIPEIEVRLKSIDEANRDDIFWCDGLALGSPTHLGTVASIIKNFWED